MAAHKKRAVMPSRHNHAPSPGLGLLASATSNYFSAYLIDNVSLGTTCDITTGV